MIYLVNKGVFRLSETKHGVKILKLNRKTYAWIMAPRIGSLLVFSSLPHQLQDILSQGKFNIYRVVNEPNLVDQLHLEVETGNGTWQGYLLPTGLPDQVNTRKRLIPTHEIITGNSTYKAELRSAVSARHKKVTQAGI